MAKEWTLGDTLRWLRDERDWSQKDLADRSGLGLRTVIRLEGREPVNYEKVSIDAIAGAFGISPAKLLAFIPPVAIPEHPDVPPPTDGQTPPQAVVLEDVNTYEGYRKEDIPLISEAQAGEGNIVYDDPASISAFAEQRVSRPFGVDDRNAFAVMVQGDSMVPVYRPGLYVIVSPNLPVADGDEVFVALHTGERLVKVAYAADGGYMLESANPAYRPRFVKREDVQVMFPVVWAKRKR